MVTRLSSGNTTGLAREDCVTSHHISTKLSLGRSDFVAKELQNENWITPVSHLNSVEELQDFLLVAAITAEVNLDPSQPDLVSWIWTTDGFYTTKSAYKAQFIGSFSRFTTIKIRKAYVKPKCTMFSWLELHGKILTADRLAIRGWPHDPICQLYLHAPRWLAIYARTAPTLPRFGALSMDGPQTSALPPYLQGCMHP
jgi:hypothetical protein